MPFVLLLACEKQPGGESGNKPDGGRRQTLTLTDIKDLNNIGGEPADHRAYISRSILTPIAGTYVQLASNVTNEEKPIYPRFTRTGDGKYVMFYHGGNASTWAGNECEYLISDDMISWGNYKKLFTATAITDCEGKANKRGYAGPHPLLLANGEIMIVCSTRAISNFRERIPDNGLAIRFSKDGGYTWGEETIVFVGTNWEPMPVQLASGRIQIYYTDSKKIVGSSAFGSGNEVISSGSSYIYSDDNGKTWLPSNPSEHIRAFAQVRYKDGSTNIMTDQMPAVIELAGSRKLAAAAESFIGGASYKTYISLAYSDDDGKWGDPDASGVLPSDRVDRFCSGCAPYLVQFPSGETVLSYNDNSVFYMRQGDADGRNYGDAIKVFSQTAATGKGFWGSLYCSDSHRMVAGVGGSNGVLQVGQFYLNHAIKAASHAVNVDGNNNEWKKSDEALYICSLGDTKATVRCSHDTDNLYFLFEITDKDISKDDYVQLFLSDPQKQALSGTSIRVKASYSGLKTAGPYAGGWQEKSIGAKVSSSYDGTPAMNSDEDHGYLVEISVPKSSVAINNGMVLANFALFDIKNGGEDAILPTADKSTEKWIPIIGL